MVNTTEKPNPKKKGFNKDGQPRKVRTGDFFGPTPGGMTPRERGKEKTEAVILWLFYWHHSTAAVISKCCNVAPFFLRTLEKKGLTQSFMTPGLFARDGWMLTKDGVLAANEILLERGLLDRCVAYDTSVSSVMHNHLRHDLCCQLAIDFLCPASYTTERMMGLQGKKDEKRPDALFVNERGRTAALEVELTVKKNGRELDRALRASESLLAKAEGDPGKIHYVVYVTPFEAIKTRYVDALEKPIGTWERKGTSWACASEAKLTDDIRESFSFHVIPKLAYRL